MPNIQTAEQWCNFLNNRYQGYLRSSFYFKNEGLRQSFSEALKNADVLMKGPIPEKAKGYQKDRHAHELAREFFADNTNGLVPALLGSHLYSHQVNAIRQVASEKNVVVATGTASGKTESFLYPILFELYRQHLNNELNQPGVRALILYPMNALANDQRERLGHICEQLKNSGSDFQFTFGQYIGETPEKKSDHRRNAKHKEENRLPGELIFREEMRQKPPHILLTNYSMLEYLLIRPEDSDLFDNENGTRWQFIVLDEAHQYRGTKGMEMGMLIRRLKQRIRSGGRGNASFRCIATSATITSEENAENKQKVADFANALFGEPFTSENILFATTANNDSSSISRSHVFLRALEGVFLIHKNGSDTVVFNRRAEDVDSSIKPLEIALCHECGQHYYVGRCENEKLEEGIRDPSDERFGVTYFLPKSDYDGKEDEEIIGEKSLCRGCGKLSLNSFQCCNGAVIDVYECQSQKEHKDQIKACLACGYNRGSYGDPVQEIVHGSDGPNSVIVTALHQKQSEDNSESRILAFADSRQEAAFFAWYAETSYNKIRNRNLIWRALNDQPTDAEGINIESLKNRLMNIGEKIGLFNSSADNEQKMNKSLKMIYGELLSSERRISLQGAGLAQWKFKLPENFTVPNELSDSPWGLSATESSNLIQVLLADLLSNSAVKLIEGQGMPGWQDIEGVWVSTPKKIVRNKANKRKNVVAWGSPDRKINSHYLPKLLGNDSLPQDQIDSAVASILDAIWKFMRTSCLIVRAKREDEFQLNLEWLRVLPNNSKIPLYQCKKCEQLSFYSIRGICPRPRCAGKLSELNAIADNHYANLYKNEKFPGAFYSREHTAQIESDAARRLQEEFKNGEINLLSSSTTFEVGVDLGELETVFMRNVPPESFNYTQRAGRAGRRETNPGFAITYCRRNPHDLYHYENPEERIINAKVRPPVLRLKNEKIILRHITAVMFSLFFKDQSARFEDVKSFVGDWGNPSATSEFAKFCNDNIEKLKPLLEDIIPGNMHDAIGVHDGAWISKITNGDSKLAKAEKEICHDYNKLSDLEDQASANKNHFDAGNLQKRSNKIAKEPTLNFLSRKAIIPKYGFPVDVVDLDTRGNGTNVRLQRDLSQAIAEYAPGGKVIANKKEWESVGIKMIPHKLPPIRRYRSTEENRSFELVPDDDPSEQNIHRYLIPEFGFVTPLTKKTKEPRGRSRRLYTTRPYFAGFDSSVPANLDENILGVSVRPANPGTMAVLCKGKNGTGFYFCLECGAGYSAPEAKHENPEGVRCSGKLDNFFLGHEFVTDVVRLQFPSVTDQWVAYSLAYAVLLGAAQTLQLPDNDLNVTITGANGSSSAYAIVIYDNVPGGAGLVANLSEEKIFRKTLENAKERIKGGCGCDSSCYGCIRSYRNQFAHPHLSRVDALNVIEKALKR